MCTPPSLSQAKLNLLHDCSVFKWFVKCDSAVTVLLLPLVKRTQLGPFDPVNIGVDKTQQIGLGTVQSNGGKSPHWHASTRRP